VKSKSQAVSLDINQVESRQLSSVISTNFAPKVFVSNTAIQDKNKILHSVLRNPFFWVVLIAFTIRLTTMGFYPIGDTTEARYSEIARKMVETNNWVMPQYENGEPFWGKPPLSIWLQAITFKIFGYSEFFARLSSILISLLIVVLVFSVAKQQRGKTVAWIAAALLTTNVLFYILSGAVMMDQLLTLGTTMAMLAFWQAMKDRGRYWGYLFFIGIAIGVMSKGPVAGVLITLPIITWLSITGNWRQGWQRIPIFRGTFVFLVLALPWFLLAENATPGFLEYYIIGEHWERFTTSGWQGNRYGNTHSTYFGAIWFEWLKAAFPMSLILITALAALIWRKKTAAITTLTEEWPLYLILWISMLLVFFSFSGNIITTYVLPSLPATALLVAGLWKIKPTIKHNYKPSRKSIAVIAIAGLLIPAIYLAAVIFHLPKVANHNSEKFLIERFNEIKANNQVRLIYLYILPSSAEYYSQGKTEVIHSTPEIRTIVNQEQSVYFAIPADYLSDITHNIEPCLNKIDRFGRYLLYSGNQKGCSN